MIRPEHLLAWLLRILGVVLLTALLAVVMPFSWMRDSHRLLGMGELPEGPITEYFARSLSALYALHGALIFFVSLDLRRYLPLAQFLLILNLLFGSGMLAIDLKAGMPPFWTFGEGPFIVLISAFLLWLATRVTQRETGPLGKS